MIYFCLNKSGLLDPILETLYEKYLNSCVVHWGEVTKEKIKQAPFFSDKWLVVITAKDLILKENVGILKNIYVDILCEVSTDEELMKTYTYCSNEIEDFVSNCNKAKRATMGQWKVDDTEFDEIIDCFTQFKSISSYKLPDSYVKTYIKWWLFTREGNVYGKNYCINLDKDCGARERWLRAGSTVLNPLEESRLSFIAKTAKGNESSLLSVLNLVGIEILGSEFISKIDEYFPKPKYITVSNFPLYLFSGQKKKKKEIFNLVYSYRGHVTTLSRSIINWCNTFTRLYEEYASGKLNLRNKDDWFDKNGFDLKINSKFKFGLWWQCINSISLETVKSIEYKMHKDSFEVYKSIVELCRKWVG